MYVIVVGGGKVGFYLTRELLEQGHEVLLIERRRDRFDRIIERLGSVAVWGEGCELSILAEAGANRCDALVAVTGDDEDNLIACQLAKHHFRIPRTIARVNNPENEEVFKTLGIDVTVSATRTLMLMIEHQMPRKALLHLMASKQKGLEILEVALSAGDRAVGKCLADLQLPPDSLISLAMREGAFVIPSGQTVLKAGDELIAICRAEREEELRGALLS